MTTATTTTVVNQTTVAAFRVWIAEVKTMIFTTLGVTNTADTGQINTATVTIPAVNTAAGYLIGRFNDTAQATSPVFFKLEFGTGNNVGDPCMWITVGTGSNGAGTITGVVMTRVYIGSGTPISTVTTYVTRGCYTTASGSLHFTWKIGSTGTINQSMAGFSLFRSADNTGAPTTDAVMLLTNAVDGTSASFTQSGYMQTISYLTSTAYGPGGAPWPNTFWGVFPFNLQSTLYSGNTQVGPVFQYTPVIGITPWLGIVLEGELAVGSTASMTLVGSTAHTYISVGSMFGPLNGLTNALLPCTGGGSTTFSMIMLWE
jgi:hypothetical protein